MLKTGCVRYALVRRALAGAQRGSTSSTCGAAAARRAARPAAREDLHERRARPPSVVVSSSAIVTRRVGQPAQVDPPLRGRLRASAATSLDVAVDADRVEEALVLDLDAQLLEPGARARRRQPADALGDRAQPLAARDRRRTSRRSPPAAPAPCRCCWSPSRGGCAARASAAPCGSATWPCASSETPMRRPGSLRTHSSRVAKNAACGPP